jgi:hypothetical protein
MSDKPNHPTIISPNMLEVFSDLVALAEMFPEASDPSEDLYTVLIFAREHLRAAVQTEPNKEHE